MTDEAMSGKSGDETPAMVNAIKGFDKGLKCRGYQFEIGKTFDHAGNVKACNSGFHAIEGYPLEVFDYYPPASSIYHDVKLSGDLSRHSGDSKIAAGKITIEAEIKIPELIARAIKFVFDRAKWSDSDKATGYRGAASSTGYRGAASSTGYRGAASSTGDRGAASSTGDRGAASSTGYQGAASSTGYRGAASSTGEDSVAMASGYGGKVKGAGGCVLFLVERDDDYKIVGHWSGQVGTNGINPDTWYTLRGGKPVEVE